MTVVLAKPSIEPGQRGVWGGWGLIKVSQSKGARGTFGGLTLFITPTSQEPLDCIRSKAHNFKEEWEGNMVQIGV